MIKSTKRFILSNEKVNAYGFNVLTGGISLEQFKANPLMLWMHTRATGGDRNQIMPLGFWDNILVEQNTLYGTPIFDDSDSFALSVYKKVENGTLKMASAGLLPVEWKDKTLVKSIMQESSICDVGANSDALAQTLYDLQGCKINLSQGIGTVISNDTTNFRGTPREISQMLSKAVADDKILPREMGFYKKIAQTDAKGVLELFEGLRNGSALTTPIMGLDWDDLWSSDGLALLKKYEPEVYNKKFFDKFGKFPHS